MIRNEYLPVHTDHTNLYICIRAVAVTAEELIQKKCTEIRMPPGTVIVGVRNWDPPITCYPWTRPRSFVDIAPLIHLYALNPHLDFTFEDAADRFSSLFSVRDNAIWRDFFEKAVWEVLIWPELQDPDVPLTKRTKCHIKIDQAYGERWMQGRQNRRKRVDEWVKTVGLGALERWEGLRVHWAQGWMHGLFDAVALTAVPNHRRAMAQGQRPAGNSLDLCVGT